MVQSYHCTVFFCCCCMLRAAGLQRLRHLSLGWCRDLGDTGSDRSNSIVALSSLTGLQQLNLAGTRADDAQLVMLLPHLRQLQVRKKCGSC